MVASEPMFSLRKENVALDALRGICAFLVVLGHSRLIYFVGGHEVPYSSVVWWQKLALLPTAFAQSSVAVFFVLSGYLVGGQVLRQALSDRFSWRVFVAKRVSRLYVVLLPGLLVTVALDAILKARYADERILFGITDANNTVGRFLCNAAFLQRETFLSGPVDPTLCGTFGSNGSLWSLSYEFWFYLVFAGVVVGLFAARRRAVGLAACSFLIAVASVVIFGADLFRLIPAWLLGAALAEWQRRRTEKRTYTTFQCLMTVALVGLAATSTSVLSMSNLPRFIVVGLACLPLIHTITSESTFWESASLRFPAFVGRWSYTLYVFHLPFIVLAGAALAHSSFSRFTTIVVIYGVGVVATVLCYPMYFLGERHTQAVRQLLMPKAPALEPGA